MKKFVLVLALLSLCSAFRLAAQDRRAKAETHPLDCALYLLSKDENFRSANRLPRILFDAGRYEDVFFVVDLDRPTPSSAEIYSIFAEKLLDQNEARAAERFLLKAMNAIQDRDDWATRGVSRTAALLVRRGRANEVAAILERQEDEESKTWVRLAVAEALFKLGQKEPAEKHLHDAFKVRSQIPPHALFALLDLAVKYSSPAQKFEFLRGAETDFIQLADESERRKNLSNLASFYLRNDQHEKAFKLWNEFGDPKDSTDLLNAVFLLLQSKRPASAAAAFRRMPLNQDKSGSYGSKLVEIYLALGDLEAALHVAREMSEGVDDYQQQRAFMLIADRMIADGKTAAALNVLDRAYRRAARVGEEHRPEDSIGASPLTRKIIYLRDIRERYFRLKRFEKALSVVNALATRDSHYRKFFAETLLDNARQQSKTLPRRKIDELLARAIAVFDEDEDYDRLRAKTGAAEIYARIGDREKAAALLAEVLEEAREHYYSDDFLIAAGEVFEKHRFAADGRMMTVLRRYLAEIED